jgi:prepilin signal peptidase PulO-like enzyme (type II secretory pathway)
MVLAGTTTFYASLGLLLVSPATGAFLKFWADRAAEGSSVIGAASHCDNCGKPLRSTQVIPIVSWLLAGGRARCCGKDIRHGLLSSEITAVGLAVWGILAAPQHLWLPTLIVAWLIQAIALLAAPDRRAAFALAMVLTWLGLFWAAMGLTGPFGMHLLGALIGASCAALGILDKIRGAPTLLLLPAGAILGAIALPAAIFLGIALALLHRGWCRLADRAGTPHATSVAIGLAGGIWLVWLYGPTLGL